MEANREDAHKAMLVAQRALAERNIAKGAVSDQTAPTFFPG